MNVCAEHVRKHARTAEQSSRAPRTQWTVPLFATASRTEEPSPHSAEQAGCHEKQDLTTVSLLRNKTEPSPHSAEQAGCHEKKELSACSSHSGHEKKEGASAEALTCSDVAIMLTIFKTAVDRHFMKRL